MISRIARIFRELRLRHRRDTVARLRHAFEVRTGLLKRKYSAEPSAWTSISQDDLEGANPDLFSTVVDAVFADVTVPSEPNSEGKYSVFGRDVSVLPQRLDWHAAIVANGAWPQTHWTQIPFKSLTNLGDIKYAWELARQQMLLSSALRFRQDGLQVCAERIRDTMVDFWDNNPREIGIHYISNMEIGIRSLVWLWTLSQCEEAGCFDEEFRVRLARELYLNGRHIAHKIHFTEATGRNNHLIGDAASLYVIALVFPQSREANRWMKQADAILRECLEQQFVSGGMHFERSFGYLCFVLEFLWCVYLADGTDSDLKNKIGNQLSQSTSQLEAFATPTGGVPAINDDDDGYVFFPNRCREQQREWLVGLRDKLLGKPNPAVGPTAATDDFHFFHDTSSGCAVFVDHHGDPFPDSGHNHASLLHILFWLNGQPILVDSGTYGYNGTGPLRNQFRSTSFHNTLTLDNQGQAEPSRGFGWLGLASPGPSKGSVTDRGLTYSGSHNCFEDATHNRFVYWNHKHRVLAIRDSVQCQAGRNVDQYWHFSPQLRVEITKVNEVLAIAGEDVEVRGHFLGGAGTTVVHADRQRLPQCALGPAYGVLENKPVARRSWTTDGEPRWTVFAAATSVSLARGLNEVEVIATDEWRIQFDPEANSLNFH